MQCVCPVCAESVDELGFKISKPEIPEPAKELICVECRMKSMQSRVPKHCKVMPRKRPSEMFPDDVPAYRPPYKD